MKSFGIAVCFFAIVAVGACRSSTPAPSSAPASAPASASASASASPDAISGSACAADGTCPAPAQCITVVGMQPDSARKECWVTCEKEGSTSGCPKGMTCDFIHDGPGRVCVAPNH